MTISVIDDLMKAITYAEYGGPAVLELTTVDKPTPGNDDVLIDIHAASLNKGDCHLMRGKPMFIRLLYGGLLRPDDPFLGMDIAGTVQVVGTDVTAFQPGDEVIGNVSECGNGSFAEYVCAPAETLVSKPPDVSFVDAAAIPTAAVSALQGLRDVGGIQSGADVLIHGASGGVGTFAVQLARARGATVAGVCSAEKVDLVESLGADRVINYEETDVRANEERYDLILDTAAAHSFRTYRRLLKPGGRYVMVGGPARRFLKTAMLGPLVSRIGNRTYGTFEMTPAVNDLSVLADHLADGTVTPAIDRTFPLSETADAIRYLEDGQARGKVVITTGADAA